ncbi:MAG: TIGR03808 family TAT-translocated repetitive protein [Rhizobiaceae bacterium]
MPSRRSFLSGLSAATVCAAIPAAASAGNWGLNANSEGLLAGSPENQGQKLQKILEKASHDGKSVFLEPGRYRIGELTLPRNAVIRGVPGSTILEFAGGKHFVFSEGNENLSVSGLTFDGQLLPVDDYADAALRINGAKQLDVYDCHFTSSASSGIEVSGSNGSLRNNLVDSAIGSAGILAVENTGLTIDGNTVEDCANGGILVHRWRRAEDNSIITNNRVRKISSIYGGTGQWGNGINTYLADGVIIVNNHVSDCAFSTIRSNSCSNIQISNNTCLRAGETSIYSEFAFEGAKITGNIVDGGVTGISIANFNEGGRLSICANNLVRNIHDNVPYKDDAHIQGIGISVEADTSVSANVIERTARFGMLLGWGPYLRNVIANANIVRETRTGMYVSVVEGIGKVNITNNIFSRVTEGGIVGYRWHDAVTSDLVTGNVGDFPDLAISGNRLDI